MAKRTQSPPNMVPLATAVITRKSRKSGNAQGATRDPLPVLDTMVAVSLHTSPLGADRLRNSIRSGNDRFVLTSADGTLSVRTKVVLDTSSSDQESVSQLGDAVVDWARGVVARNGRRTTLSRTELRILSCLLEGAGSVVPRQQLIDRAWPLDRPANPVNALAVYVCYVRRRLATLGLRSVVRTARGPGYALSVESRTTAKR